MPTVDESISAQGFMKIGSLSHTLDMGVWWNAAARVELLVLRCGRVTMLRGAKSYFVTSRSRDGETWARDIDLEAWVLAKLQELVMSDGDGVEDATERFVRAAREQRASGEDCGPLRRELAQMEATVDALVTGLDPANLPLVNEKLSKLRHRREFLQGQLRAAESAALDENALRWWATERLTLLGEMAAGRRDERARQALASYVDEIVIDPATKTGVLVANGGLPGPDGPTDGDGPTDANGPGQKHHDPPRGGSQVAPIEDGGWSDAGLFRAPETERWDAV